MAIGIKNKAISANEDLIGTIADKIRDTVNPLKIVLFGSYAREQAGAESDIDIFVETDGHEPSRISRRKIENALWPRPVGVDLIVRTPDEVAWNEKIGNPLYTHHIFREGIVLYEQKR